MSGRLAEEKRRARLRVVHAKQAPRLKRTFLKGTGTSTDLATVMSREFKTIFFYRADDDLLLTFVASRSDGRGSFCFFLGLIMVHSKSGGAPSAMSPNDAVDGCAGRPAEGRRCESVTVKA